MIKLIFEMKSKKQKVPFKLSSHQYGLLMPIADIHYGVPSFPETRFVHHLRWGVDRGAYFIGLGDYLDLTSETQRSVISSLREETKAQLDEMIREKLRKFANLMSFTKGHWIGLIRGNHTWTFADGTCSEQYLAKLLGHGCLFLGDAAFIRIKNSRIPEGHPEGHTKLFVAHSRTGGTGMTITSHTSKPEYLTKSLDAHIVLLGHSHAKCLNSIDRQDLTPDGVHYHKTIYFGRAGSFMRGYYATDPISNNDPVSWLSTSYVEQKLLPPCTLGGFCISLGAARIKGSKYWRPVIHHSE